MLRRLSIICISIFFTASVFSDASTLSPKEVNGKVQEILKAHVRYKQLTTELTERILRNFIEELDPSKTYFIESDIQDWWYPSEELKSSLLSNYKSANFAIFNEIYKQMTVAIKRRNELEKIAETATLPEPPKPQDFTDIPWSTSKDDLLNRLLSIRSLQLQAAEKINEEEAQQFIKRVEKRRQNRELEIIGSSESDVNNLILSTILKATAASLDTHTNYFTPSEAKQFMVQVQQRLFGIGALLRDNLNGFCISRILEGSPVEKSKKFKLNDLIIAVDQKTVIGMDIIDAVDLIRGEKGTKVTLTVLREKDNKEQEKFDISIKRDEIILEETRFDSSIEPYADGAIAHIKLFSFYQDPKFSSFSDLKNVLEKAQKEYNLKGVILDLRNNSGGLLPQAVAVTGLFITKGIVASIKDSTGHIQHLRDTEGKVTWDGPLVVLTNRASASAAEIVTQTLQDYGRAIVVGDEKTFGKGSFQTFTLDTSNIAKVNPKGEYKVTRGLYYTVSGKSPQLAGVKADITVPGILSQLDVGEEFAKFPLEGDQIEPNFEDNLSDIPPMHRKKIRLLYKHNIQPILTSYTQYLDILNSNSIQRIENNKNYQKFLEEAGNKNFDAPIIEMFGQSDLQLTETFNIIKDLIYFTETEHKQAASY